MTREEYLNSIKSAVLELGKKEVMTFLMTQAPKFFGNFLVNPIVGLIINWVLTILIEKTEIAVFFLYTDIRTNKQASEFVDAAYANHQAQLNGTPEEKLNAENNLMEKFKLFASITA